jgi:hypothetical protein
VYQAANLQFDRIVDEFVRWRTVPEDERSPAPAWWWGPAFELLGVQNALPDEVSMKLGLPGGASYADGAQIFFKSLAGQTSLPSPDEFPRRQGHSDPA